MSFHGVKEETWKFITQQKESIMPLVVYSTCLFKGAGVYVGWHFVVMKQNYLEAPIVVDLANVLAVDELSFLRLQPQGRAKTNWHLIALSDGDWIKFFKLMRELILSYRKRIEFIHEDKVTFVEKLNQCLLTCGIKPEKAILVNTLLLENITVLRFGCPINWFFKILHENEYNKVKSEGLVKFGEACVIYHGKHCHITPEGMVTPCVAFKQYAYEFNISVNDENLIEKLERTRREILAKYMDENCRKCRWFNICNAKCYAIKKFYNMKIDPLCKLTSEVLKLRT